MAQITIDEDQLVKKPPLLNETGTDINESLRRIAKGVEKLGGISEDFHYDETAGEYDNIAEVFELNADGKTYSVEIPKGTATACTKADSNAGLTVTPSTATTAGTDDYNAINAFKCYCVNATVDSDGVPHVNAIEGKDTRFRRDGSNGNVFVMTPVLYYETIDEDGNVRLSISDTEAQNLKPQPGAMLPDGTMRGFMLYAAYAGVKDDSGKYASISGKACWNGNISHNTLHTISMPTGCSGKTIADDWYVKVMMLMKYATKSSQGVFAGCSSYDKTAAVTVAETDASRVIVSATDAAFFLAGSWVYVATSRSGSMYKVLSFTTYDDSNVAIDIDGTVTTTTDTKCITAPYGSGYCDSVLGTDGTPVSRTSGKEPFKIQNIECMVGVYEVLADTILKGSPDQEAWVCYDKANYSTSITENYTHVGTYSGNANGWNYPLYAIDADGLLLPQKTGGSSSAGLGDGYYLPAASESLFEWLGVGILYAGSLDGLFYVTGTNGLSNAAWYIGSRLSALGRSGVSA